MGNTKSSIQEYIISFLLCVCCTTQHQWIVCLYVL